MSEYLVAFLLPDFAKSWIETTQRLQHHIMTIAEAKQIAIEFGGLGEHVRSILRRMTFHFSESTNATTSFRLRVAHQKLRRQLDAGLVAGNPVSLLAKRVRRVFADPERAFTIAATESSRALHSGQYEAARQSGIVAAKRWILSSDACTICQTIARRGPVALEEPFVVLGAGPYGRIMHPPAHPHCMCTWAEVTS